MSTAVIDPTREQIQRRTREIRALWSPQERQRRSVVAKRSTHWFVPCISVSSLIGAVAEELADVDEQLYQEGVNAPR